MYFERTILKKEECIRNCQGAQFMSASQRVDKQGKSKTPCTSAAWVKRHVDKICAKPMTAEELKGLPIDDDDEESPA